jgi:truncated hemoglobin YjbI
MREAHRGIGVTAASFELAAQLLSDTLVSAEVEQADIDAIMAKVASLRADIVEK